MRATVHTVSALLSFSFFNIPCIITQCGLEPKTTKQKRSEKINIGQFVSLLKNIKKKKSNWNQNVWVLWGFYLRVEEQGKFLTMLESSCNLS